MSLTRMQQRRGTQAQWEDAVPGIVLAAGEIGVVTDGDNQGKFKIGDGSSVWNDLSYQLTDAQNANIYAKINGYQAFTGIKTFSSGINLADQKITNVGTPTSNKDATTKQYVDDAIAGLTWKQSANLLATSNVPLTGNTNTVVIDGHSALTSAKTGYRLLLTGQTTTADKGIYTYTDNGVTYTLTRSSDADVYTELKGATVFIEEGTAYANTSWTQSNHYITSFSGQTWVQFAGASSITAGAGLVATGNVFDVVGTTDRISVGSGAVDIASTYIGQNSITKVGNSAAGTGITTGTWKADTIAAIYGGTGQGGATPYTVGDMLYANTTSSLAKLNAQVAGSVLISTGTGTPTAPAWGQVATAALANNAVTNAKLAQTASYSILGNDTVGTANVSSLGSAGVMNVINNAQASTSIATAKGGTGKTSWVAGGLAYASATNVLNELAIGTPGYPLTVVNGMPSWANQLTTAGIGTDQVTYAKIQKVASAFRILGNATASTAVDVAELDGNGVISVINGIAASTAVSATKGGTGKTTWAAGDIAYASAANTLAGLAIDATAGKALITNGTAPVWGAVDVDGISDAAVTTIKIADSTGSTTGVTTAKLANTSVTYAKIQNVAANTILGNNTGAAATASEVTSDELAAMVSANATPGTGRQGTGAFVFATSPTITHPTLAAAASTAAGQAPLYIASGGTANLLATPVAGAVEFDGTAFYATTNSGRGAIATTQFSIGTNTFISTTAAQNLFPAANDTLTVAGATTYLLEMQVYINVPATSSVAHTATFTLSGGTATFTAIDVEILAQDSATGSATFGTAPRQYRATAATAQSIWTTASTAATASSRFARVRGIIRVNAGGTFIPQFTTSAATVAIPAGSAANYITMTPIGSNTVAAVGAWA